MTRAKVPARGFVARKHEHAACVQAAISAAESACARSGQRLTALRRRVLELVWNSHEPVKAYQLLDELRAERARAAPPTVYRALEFLVNEGLVHRLESMSAFVGCVDPRRRHEGQFLICNACGVVAEIDDPALSERIGSRARRMGFTVQRQTVEVAGLCPQCQA
ncbi:MAG: Fur family transcriptional regulator [Gammaproteobacteria bacterium]